MKGPIQVHRQENVLPEIIGQATRMPRHPHHFGHRAHRPVHDVENDFRPAAHAMPWPCYREHVASAAHHFRQIHFGLVHRTEIHLRHGLRPV